MEEIYTTTQGDTWDLISYKVYGREHYADQLMIANRKYNKMVVFPANVTLSVPTIKTPISSDLPPWKRGGGNE